MAMFYSHRILLPLFISLSLSLSLSLLPLPVQIKPRKPRKRIKKLIMNLAADKSQEFGKKVDEFISEVKGQCNDPHQKMLAQVCLHCNVNVCTICSCLFYFRFVIS